MGWGKVAKRESPAVHSLAVDFALSLTYCSKHHVPPCCAAAIFSIAFSSLLSFLYSPYTCIIIDPLSTLTTINSSLTKDHIQPSSSLQIHQSIPAMSSTFDAQQTNFTTTNERSAVKQTQDNTAIKTPYHKQYSDQGSTSPDFEDSGFFENEESNTPRADYQDFILFSQPANNSFHTSNFFADADSSTVANPGSFYERENSEETQVGRDVSYTAQNTPPPRAEFFDAVRDAIQQSVNEAITVAITQNYEDQSQHSRSPPPTPYLRPLELWEHSYERHEAIAYRFEQPPHLVQAKSSRQQ